MRRTCKDERSLITIVVNGHPLAARKGDTLAVTLGCNAVLALRNSPRGGTPRGAFCFMGACQECAIEVDGRIRQACLTPVAEGMVVELRGAP